MKLFETSLEKIARIITRQYGVNVVFQGTGAATDGKTIYLPSLPAEGVSEEVRSDLNGYVDHEAAHCLFTDFPQISKCINEFHKKLFNHAEDSRIEKLMVQKYPGCRLHLDALNEKWLGITNDRWSEISLVGRIQLGLRAIQEGRTPRLDADSEPYFTAENRRLAASMAFATSSRDLVIITLNITRALEAQMREQNNTKGKSNDSSKGKKGSKRDDTDRGDSGEADGPESTENVPEESVSEEGQGEGKEGSKKGGSSKEESREEASEKEGEKDNHRKDCGEEDSKRRKAQKEGSQEDREGDESSAEGSQESRKSQEGRQGKESGTEGSESSESSAEGEEASQEGRQSKESGTEGSESSEGEEGSAEGSKGTSGNAGSDEDSSGSSEDAQAEPSRSAGTLTERDLHIVQNDGITDIHSFIEEEVKQVMEDHEKNVTKGDWKYEFDSTRYIPYTTKNDRTIDHTKEGNRDQYSTLLSKVRPLVTQCKNELERALFVRSQRGWKLEQERGVISTQQISRLLVEPGFRKPFKKVHQNETRDVAIQIVNDLSGSMCGDKIELSIETNIALGEALKLLGIPFEIVGFNAMPAKREARRDKLESRTQMREGEEIHLHVFKGFSDTRLDGVTAMKAKGCNVDGESLRMAAKRLALQTQKRKIMIVLSDGMPACSTVPCAKLNTDLVHAVKQINEFGIEVIAIGILTDAVQEFYKHHVVLNNLQDLPKQAMKTLKDAILTSQKEVRS